MAKKISDKTAQKTPIEVVLAIDDEGMTTASAVYEWLELNPSNFSRWCKTNIVENPSFTENIDYFPFVMMKNERFNPNEKTDYKITSDVAKMLCLMARNEKGKEAYRYFIKVETALKEVTKKAIAEIDSFRTVIQEMQAKLATYESQQKALEDTANNLNGRLGIVESGTVFYEPSAWISFISKRIDLLSKYHWDPNANRHYTWAQMFHYIMDEMERLYPGYNTELHEVEKLLVRNTDAKDTRPLQIIDYSQDLRYKFHKYVHNQLYDRGILDEEEDRENITALFRKLFPPLPY